MTDPASHATGGPRPADVLRPLRRVRQIREFTTEPVDPEAIAAIVNVARWTGSSRNSQPWRFLVIRDLATIRRLHESGLPQTRALATATAAIAVVLPAAGHELGDAYDDGRVAERILDAASLLGLGAGITWVRSDVRDAFAAILGLREDRYVRTIMALGHPTEAALLPKSAPGAGRVPYADLVFEERWPAGDR